MSLNCTDGRGATFHSPMQPVRAQEDWSVRPDSVGLLSPSGVLEQDAQAGGAGNGQKS